MSNIHQRLNQIERLQPKGDPYDGTIYPLPHPKLGYPKEISKVWRQAVYNYRKKHDIKMTFSALKEHPERARLFPSKEIYEGIIQEALDLIKEGAK